VFKILQRFWFFNFPGYNYNQAKDPAASLSGGIKSGEGGATAWNLN